MTSTDFYTQVDEICSRQLNMSKATVFNFGGFN